MKIFISLHIVKSVNTSMHFQRLHFALKIRTEHILNRI
uniref:Uncharacterized protein n=1 Tax=Anguilla anguilla TaxID=7936 RepID=A0A0E9U4E5_ANGAN